VRERVNAVSKSGKFQANRRYATPKYPRIIHTLYKIEQKQKTKTTLSGHWVYLLMFIKMPINSGKRQRHR